MPGVAWMKQMLLCTRTFQVEQLSGQVRGDAGVGLYNCGSKLATAGLLLVECGDFFEVKLALDIVVLHHHVWGLGTPGSEHLAD